MKIKVIKPFKDNDQNICITICDKNPDIIKIFASYFEKIDYVQIVEGNIFNISADAIISPANSFGDMGGGLDKEIDNFFKKSAQQNVRKYIQSEFLGELPVGIAAILPTNSLYYPFLIIAPTMRVPSNVSNTINAYLAMRAILVSVIKHNKTSVKPIQHIVVSSLCTGVGGMFYESSAEQMLVAITQMVEKKYENIVHPLLAPYVMHKNA